MSDGTTTEIPNESSDATPARGELFILSAPSGTGKTTLIRELMEGELSRFIDIHFAISHTTRSPRESEEDGQDYHFTEEPEFRRMISEDRFLEWAEVHNNYYGTSLDEVLPHLERGVDVLMDIDVQGAERVLGLHQDPEGEPLRTAVHSIFIMPPSHGALQKRLYQRNLDDPDEIERRLAVSKWEMKRSRAYQYAIVNNDARAASYVLASIILEKRHRQARMRSVVDTILEDFQQAG